MKVTLKEEKGKLVVDAPFCPSFVNAANRLNGDWSPTAKRWYFRPGLRPQVEASLLVNYGCDGVSDPGRVDVRIEALTAHVVDQQPVSIGPVLLATAWGRDTGAKPCDDVAILHGEPRSGGSVKNWKTVVPAGVVFQVSGVYRPLAERLVKDFGAGSGMGWVVTLVEETAVAPEPPAAPSSHPAAYPPAFMVKFEGEYAAKIAELAAERGIDSGEYVRQAVVAAIQHQLLDKQIMDGKVKGGFSRPGQRMRAGDIDDAEWGGAAPEAGSWSPAPRELAALVLFKNAYGARWRQRLLLMWQGDITDARTGAVKLEPDVRSLLQAIRNTPGAVEAIGSGSFKLPGQAKAKPARKPKSEK